jgi:hypothetical protein
MRRHNMWWIVSKARARLMLGEVKEVLGLPHRQEPISVLPQMGRNLHYIPPLGCAAQLPLLKNPWLGVPASQGQFRKSRDIAI